MASNISKIPSNMLSNPNLDAADTGVDPTTGRLLSKKERIAVLVSVQYLEVKKMKY